MIKRFALLALLCIVTPAYIFAQDVEAGSEKKSTVEKPSRDFVMLQFTYEGWQKPDSIKTTGIGRGVNAFICYDFPIKKTHLSFAAGIGIGSASIYLNNQSVKLVDSPAQATFVPEQKDYKKYKVNTAYVEAPFELRYFGNMENRNRGFKAAIGLKVEALVGAHYKGKLSGTKTVEKLNTKNDINPWNFAATLRLGWGNFSLLGTYNLNTLYKEKEGPSITPYSVGICLTGL